MRSSIPIFVRAGALVFEHPVVQHTGELRGQPLRVHVVPGADGEATLYEDDGRSFNYRRGEWLGIDMRWRDAKRRLTFQLAPGSRMLPPFQRPIEVRVAGEKTSRRVVFTGQRITQAL